MTRKTAVLQKELVTIKRCAVCSAAYTRSGWEMLPYVGVQKTGDEYPSMELRNCGCGTTLAIEIPR